MRKTIFATLLLLLLSVHLGGSLCDSHHQPLHGETDLPTGDVVKTQASTYEGYNVNEPVNRSSSYAAEWFGIEFCPQSPFGLEKVELIAGNGTGEYIVQLRSDDGGVPSDAILREVRFSMVNTVAWQGAKFNRSYPLLAGEIYWITFKPVLGSQASIAESGVSISHVWDHGGDGWDGRSVTFPWMIKLFRAPHLPTEMPVVFVDPLNITVDQGQVFEVRVILFNLTNRFHITDEEWSQGERLPPSGQIFNYSLGNLYGLDIHFSWDPTLLRYINHTVRVPVAVDLGGVLNNPIWEIKDEVDAKTGTYWLAATSLFPADEFNCPRVNATIFTMVFNVTKLGACTLNLDHVDLAIPKAFQQFRDVSPAIPHWVESGTFRTPNVYTRIVNLDAGNLGDGEFRNPVIHGENATVEITVRNDGETLDRYNLTLFRNATTIEEWNDQSLEVDNHDSFNFTFDAYDLSLGIINLTAEAEILSSNITIADELSEELRIVDTPILTIDGTATTWPGGRVYFDASRSAHGDPDGEIREYEWTFWAPGETYPRFEYHGKKISHLFSPTTKLRHWRVILTVTDGWGITFDEARPATTPYRKERILTIEEFDTEPPTITITTPVNATYDSESVPLSVTLYEETSWIGYSVDSNRNITNTGNTTIQYLPDGPHSLIVYANDTNGNMGSSQKIYFTIDTTPPTISIILPENATYTDDSTHLVFRVNEATAWTGYSLDLGMIMTSGNSTMSHLSNGIHSIIVYANDTVGNFGSSHIIYFTINTQDFDGTPNVPWQALMLVLIILACGVGIWIVINRLHISQRSKTLQRSHRL